MDTNEMIQQFIAAFPDVVREHVRAQLGRQVQHTLTAADAERLNRWPGCSYREGQVVTASVAGFRISAGDRGRVSEYVTLRLADGSELRTVPRQWTEELL